MTDGFPVDLTTISRWMDGQGLPGGDITEVELLAGGTQNILVRFVRGGERYVLRRPPGKLRPKSNAALSREIRFLRALHDSPVPVPALIAACEDESVLPDGAVFYLMENVEGVNPIARLAPLHREDASVRHEIGVNAARSLALLGEVDHIAVGLGDIGNPAGFLERQVPRWLDLLDSYNRMENYPESSLIGVQSVARWLEENRPAAFTPGIMHGDYHLSNILVDPQGADVRAIVDWEMTTVGDPLLDLGWLLATWPDPRWSGQPPSELRDLGGLPSRSAVIDTYASLSSRSVENMDWYQVMACFKLGIVLEGTFARGRAGLAPEETGARLHQHALDLLVQAQTVIDA